MITKFVLIVWFGSGNSQMLSTQSFDTQAECESIATVLETEMKSGDWSFGSWYRCKPYTFDQETKE
jgi:hypothetical protein